MTETPPPVPQPTDRRGSDRRVEKDPAYSGPDRRVGDRRARD